MKTIKNRKLTILRYIAVGFTFGLLVAGDAHCKKLKRDSTILIMGNENLAPIVYNENGETKGLAVEIAEELEEHMEISVDVESEDWSVAQKMLETGEADALLHINKTQDRMELFDFSEPLLESDISIFTNNPGLKVNSAEELSKLSVGVEKDGFPKSLLGGVSGIELTEVKNLNEGFSRLAENDIDVFIADKWAGSHVLATGGIEGIWITGDPIAVQTSHIAVQRGNSELLSAINDAIKEIKKDGAYQSILKNWEPEETIFQTKEQLNNYRLRIGIYATSAIALVMTLFGFVLFKQLKVSKSISHELSTEKERLKTTLFSVGDGVVSTDEYGNITVMNSVAEKLTGWSIGNALERPFSEIFNIKSENMSGQSFNLMKHVLETGKEVETEENTVLVSKDGSRIFIEGKSSPMVDVDGSILGSVTVFRDFTERREKQKQIEYLSFHDQLTGLYSRYFFEKELLNLDNDNFLPLSLILIDVNGLKLINDAFGHKKGDLLLKKVSESLMSVCAPNGIVSRIGGDEFTVLLPNTDAELTETLSDRICRTLSEKSVESIPITASCGFSTKSRVDKDISEVFREAEDNMYHSKTSEKKSIRYNSINIIMKTLFEKTPREEAHSERVSELCMEIAVEMGMNPSEANMLNTAGLLHDIGKIAIRNSILDKEGPLDDWEWNEIRKHPEISYNILSSVNDYGPLADVALSHHERWDGKGYPRQLSGSDIPLNARIIAIADSYDAMTSDRTYRKAMDPSEALSEIEKGSGKQFDPELVTVFKKVFYKLENKDAVSGHLSNNTVENTIDCFNSLWIGE